MYYLQLAVNGLAQGLVIGLAELLLGDVAVMALQLLLGAQLEAEVGQLALAALAMLAGAVFAAVHRRLGAAPDVLAHAAIDFILCGFALAHRIPFQNVAPESSRFG